jgi:hypothetical protein
MNDVRSYVCEEETIEKRITPANLSLDDVRSYVREVISIQSSRKCPILEIDELRLSIQGKAHLLERERNKKPASLPP